MATLCAKDSSIAVHDYGLRIRGNDLSRLLFELLRCQVEYSGSGGPSSNRVRSRLLYAPANVTG
jgi:hypothetical protein